LDLDLLVLFPTIIRNDGGRKVHTPMMSMISAAKPRTITMPTVIITTVAVGRVGSGGDIGVGATIKEVRLMTTTTDQLLYF